ncbi:MAG: Gfo/Idh/MocA family oxidoreductase, partial [Clostridiales bacterium]|nr:Gfo/Idh/MocA family oxidoreductase [Clostridiales bacterium]
GYQSRYRPDSQYLKKECENGVLGEIYYARAKAIRRRAVPTWGVFLNEYEQGGGPLIDIGTHALDLTLWMMDNYKPKFAVGTVYHKLNGETEPANAFGPWNPAEFTVEDSAFGFVVMENGATIGLEASWALNTLDVHEAKTVLCGTKAGADMNDGLVINGVKHDRQYVERPALGAGSVAFFEGDADLPEVVEQKVFLNAVLGKSGLIVLPEQAAVVTQILEAIYESAKTGRQVFF